MPQVSVIIPTYKHQDLILETLDSVFAQTFTDYEVIVINDGSPDDTAKVLRPLAEAGRIRYTEQGNGGQAAARNRGIALAEGEFIALLDDDDLWPPDKLEWQVAALRAAPEAVLAYGYSEAFGDKPSIELPGRDTPNGDVEAAFLRQNWITTPGQTLIRASALKQIGSFDPQLWGVDDWDLYIRLAGIGAFLYKKKVALHYRVHKNNASKNLMRMYVNDARLRSKHRERYQKYGMDTGISHLPVLYSNFCIDIALQEKNAGSRRDFYKMLGLAIYISPLASLRRAKYHCQNLMLRNPA